TQGRPWGQKASGTRSFRGSGWRGGCPTAAPPRAGYFRRCHFSPPEDIVRGFCARAALRGRSGGIHVRHYGGHRGAAGGPGAAGRTAAAGVSGLRLRRGRGGERRRRRGEEGGGKALAGV